MKVLAQRPIGYQKVTNPKGKVIYQLRSVCAVRPSGFFAGDPTGTITEIELVSFSEYKNYFDWGKIGDRIIKRAAAIKKSLEQNLRK